MLRVRSDQFFESKSFAALCKLTEVIIPGEAHSPGALELNVPSFLDDFIGHSPDHQQDLWNSGLRSLDEYCYELHSRYLADLEHPIAEMTISALMESDPDKDPLVAFLRRAKTAILKSYYRTEHGFHNELKIAEMPRKSDNAGNTLAISLHSDAIKLRYDVIVVGSGATGSWAAKELVEAGLDVLMLESGGPLPVSDHPKQLYELRYRNMFDNSALNGATQPVQTQCWACDEFRSQYFINDLDNPYGGAAGFTWIRGSSVGGRMNIWGRQVYRYSHGEFSGEFLKSSEVAWPFTYEDIAPFYDEVESTIGVSGNQDHIPNLPDGKFLPPMELTEGERHLKSAVESRWPERRVIIGRTATLTEKLRGRPACRSAGHCYRGCETKSFFDPMGTILSHLATRKNFLLRPYANVTRILVDDETGLARGVRFIDTRTGVRHEVDARAVVLAGSTLGSTRLLLASRSSHFPNGIGASSGVLGRYLHGHIHSITCTGYVPWLRKPVGVHDEGRPNQIYIPQFQNVSNETRDSRFTGGFGIEGAVKHYMQPVDMLSRPGVGLALKKSIREDSCPAYFFLTAFGAMLPRGENRVALTGPVDRWGETTLDIKCTYGENDRAMAQVMSHTLAEIAQSANFKISRAMDQPGTPGLCVHEVGTARMGRDAATSVLDPHNRAWDAPNVLVVDGACFPSSGPQNPTLTMMAISLRAARQLAADLRSGVHLRRNRESQGVF